MLSSLDKNKIVSVIIPSYNHAQYISECIISIINQTYKNIELIVIDDGSTDNSRQILTKLNEQYNFVLIFQENNGVSFTINRGIREFAHGEFIAICASDDYWPNTKVELQVAFLENNRFYPVCFGKHHFVNERSEIIWGLEKYNKVLKGGFIFNEILLLKINMPVNLMYRREIFDELGYFDEKILAEDYYMNLKISYKYPIGFINEYLSFYRLTNIKSKHVRYDKISLSNLYTIENYRNHPNYSLAKNAIYLARFENFSPFIEFKSKAINEMILAFPLFYTKRFIMATIRLFFVWKKI